MKLVRREMICGMYRVKAFSSIVIIKDEDGTGDNFNPLGQEIT